MFRSAEAAEHFDSPIHTIEVRMRFLLLVLSLSLAACVISPAADDMVNITFVVTVPANTPANDKISIVGDVAELREWKAGDPVVVLNKRDDGVYAALVKLRRDVEVHYKMA